MFQRLILSILLAGMAFGQAGSAIKCGFHESKQTETLAKVSADRGFDYLDESALSPDGHFRIHFTRSGVHAVSGYLEAGIPNFIQEAGIAADSAYKLIVDELGFLPPLADDGVDGIELDIYVVDMKENYGSVYYGMTSFPSSFTTPYSGLPTYLEIDNDYVEPQYATSGLAALRVTIAHEFFHMVQLRYAHPFSPYDSNPYWYEISSTWMEEKCYPEVNDYHAYVADNFYQTSFPNLEDPSAGFRYSYGHGLFGQVLDMEYGYSGSKHIMLDIWENLNDQEATDNLQKVLKSTRWNSSLADALGKYTLYNVFTGSRAIEGQYYQDAAQLPEVKTTNESLPALLPFEYEVLLEPLQMRYKRFTSYESRRIFLRGEDLTTDQRVYLTKTNSNLGSSLLGAVTNTWLGGGDVLQNDYMILPMVNGNRSISATFSLHFEATTTENKPKIQSVRPNPGLLATSAGAELIRASIVIPEPGYLRINIYDIRGRIVHTQSEYLLEGVHLVDLDLPGTLSTGMYIMQSVLDNRTSTAKFTIYR
ncbi:MAG: T9SS type A sorting domain-containing protein [Candidatus Marinimicrobia bacterium]|nr:T9SS type A sorting domain-containing protein [Candidatus Neomarinimicrobiota bacterium]MCF7850176.1 T9SS type A sorting domain-containing protein [Candidatus Neomarinimicrobiota bacterium]MCF7905202.1 T9SS type A sorting domain-containing protein [Candidatus Neomarinimicrobiota bacterium]